MPVFEINQWKEILKANFYILSYQSILFILLCCYNFIFLEEFLGYLRLESIGRLEKLSNFFFFGLALFLTGG